MKKRNNHSILATIVMLFCVAVHAKVILVAKTGATFATIQAGVSSALPNDTIIVSAGTYNEAVAFSKSGSAIAGYITLLASPGAIIDGAGKNAPGILIASQNYIRVIGFEIQNFKGTNTPIGISVEGNSNHLEIIQNVIHHIESPKGNAHGIAVYGTEATPISNILINKNEIKNCQLGQSESLVLNGNVTDFIVSNNYIHHNDNIGIDFIGFEGNGPLGQDQARNGVCIGNRVYGISTRTNTTYNERSAGGIYVDGGKNIVIEHNIVDSNDIGIEVASEWPEKTTSQITVRNNFVSRSFQGNIMCGGYEAGRGNADSIFIINNTLYQGKEGEVILQFNTKNIHIKNNILHALSNGQYLVNNGSNNNLIAVDNNLYFGASTNSSGAWIDSHAKYANPTLVAAPQDLHIKSGSPAIDAGLDLGINQIGVLDIDQQIRVHAGKVDMGADEISEVSNVFLHKQSLSMLTKKILGGELFLVYTLKKPSVVNFTFYQSNGQTTFVQPPQFKNAGTHEWKVPQNIRTKAQNRKNYLQMRIGENETFWIN